MLYAKSKSGKTTLLTRTTVLVWLLVAYGDTLLVYLEYDGRHKRFVQDSLVLYRWCFALELLSMQPIVRVILFHQPPKG